MKFIFGFVFGCVVSFVVYYAFYREDATKVIDSAKATHKEMTK